MSVTQQQVVPIDHPSQAGEARRRAQAMAEILDFSDETAGRLALAVTEAGTNIARHASSGMVVLRALEHGGALGIEMLALDSGPGIGNVTESLRDGHSTAGSSGTGLGAIRRMSDGFDVYSRPGKGVAMRCEVWNGVPRAPHPALAVGAVSTAKPGEDVCGDAWVVIRDRLQWAILVVDGLGHGADAAAAARAATAAVAGGAGHGAARIMDNVHGALRSTRGAAAAVATLRMETHTGEFCGVGNVSCLTRVAGRTRSLVSQNGILGHQVRKTTEMSFPFPGGALLVMHSDGIATRWQFDDYPGLESRHPGVIAGVLYRDFRRERDDATILVARLEGRP